MSTVTAAIVWSATILSPLLPRSCAGCGRWDTGLCPDCLALLRGPSHPVVHADAAGELPVEAVSHYRGPVRTAVLAWKNGAREDLRPVIDAVAAAAGAAWASRLEDSDRAAVESSLGLLVVPAPSGLARRLRGRLVAASFADAVARGVAQGWCHGSPGAPGAGGPVAVLSADVLRRAARIGGATGTGHQAGRSARSRRANRAAPPRVLAPVSGWCALLVDDVVTTGATLGACARALSARGARVIGALTLAAPPPPADREDA